MRRPAATALLWAVLVLMTAACSIGGSDAPAGDDDTKRLTAAMSADLLTLFPPDETVVGTDVFGHIFETLATIGRDGELEPQLATEWSTEDGTEWEFTLDPEATWHNGEPVTAADVAYTYNYIVADEGLATHGYANMVEQAEAVDDHTVRFTLNSPIAAFARWTSLIFIIPDGTAEEMTQDEFSQNPVGSGPFKFREREGGQRLVLEANQDFRGGPPPIDELTFVSVPDESARITGLETGELDVIGEVPPPEVARLEENPDVKVLAAPNNRNEYLGMNTNLSPTDDVRVREAINLAVDRTALTEQVLEGLGDPIGQPAAPVTFGYSDDPRFAPADYDPDRAKQLLQEAGYAGEEIVFTYPTSDLPFAVPVSEAIGGYLTDVGLNVRLEAVEWGTMIERWRASDFQHLHLFGYGPSILDANLILNSLYETGSRGFYQTEELDRMVADQAAETDEARRLEKIEEIWAVDQDQMLNAWLYTEYDAYAVAADVEWEPLPSRRMYLLDADRTG